MALKSALEDLLGTTLAGVAGTVGKVEYLASLRDAASGNYSHWGLTRAHGETAAQLALAEAHRLMFLRLLRTPLRIYLLVMIPICGMQLFLLINDFPSWMQLSGAVEGQPVLFTASGGVSAT